MVTKTADIKALEQKARAAAQAAKQAAAELEDARNAALQEAVSQETPPNGMPVFDGGGNDTIIMRHKAPTPQNNGIDVSGMEMPDFMKKARARKAQASKLAQPEDEGISLAEEGISFDEKATASLNDDSFELGKGVTMSEPEAPSKPKAALTMAEALARRSQTESQVMEYTPPPVAPRAKAVTANEEARYASAVFDVPTVPEPKKWSLYKKQARQDGSQKDVILVINSGMHSSNDVSQYINSRAVKHDKNNKIIERNYTVASTMSDNIDDLASLSLGRNGTMKVKEKGLHVVPDSIIITSVDSILLHGFAPPEDMRDTSDRNRLITSQQKARAERVEQFVQQVEKLSTMQGENGAIRHRPVVLYSAMLDSHLNDDQRARLSECGATTISFFDLKDPKMAPMELANAAIKPLQQHTRKATPVLTR